jgi:phage terminase small subunit
VTGKSSIAEADEAPPEWGPSLLALTEKQRRFVAALFMAPRRKGRVTWAARAAGYGGPGAKNTVLRASGGRLMGDEKVKAAIIEYGQTKMRGMTADAVAAIEALVNNPGHRDHARAVGMIMDRADPVTTISQVNVTDNRDATPMALEKVMARIEELARKAGVPAMPAPRVIDGECEEAEAAS